MSEEQGAVGSDGAFLLGRGQKACLSSLYASSLAGVGLS